ncbi:MAG: hypothetical protein IPK17_01520 [Chloroflexi bacterium]|uniref:hypothetical protein n=1 Tax=Candidatus Flexifilum breve TaxID=3140694 RepID=UPI0031367EB5|nr:hypothetical protein [Chloroflexota bacterium]
MAVVIPPTPTPMPAAVAPPINVPTWNVWQFADDAVGAWNRFGSTPTQVIQGLRDCRASAAFHDHPVCVCPVTE